MLSIIVIRETANNYVLVAKWLQLKRKTGHVPYTMQIIIRWSAGRHRHSPAVSVLQLLYMYYRTWTFGIEHPLHNRLEDSAP